MSQLKWLQSTWSTCAFLGPSVRCAVAPCHCINCCVLVLLRGQLVCMDGCNFILSSGLQLTCRFPILFTAFVYYSLFLFRQTYCSDSSVLCRRNSCPLCWASAQPTSPSPSGKENADMHMRWASFRSRCNLACEYRLWAAYPEVIKWFHRQTTRSNAPPQQ